MQYSEFASLCSDRGIEAPSWDAYTNIVEFVYAYHPLFDGGDRKEKCIDLYAAGGLYIFRLMREDAETAKQHEDYIRELRHKYASMRTEYEGAMAGNDMWRESIRKDGSV